MSEARFKPVWNTRTRGRRRPNAPIISDRVWASHRSEIEKLYLQSDMTLDELMNFMLGARNFGPSKRQYTKKLKDWGFSKYKTSAEKINVNSTTRRLQDEHHSSVPPTSIRVTRSFYTPQHSRHQSLDLLSNGTNHQHPSHPSQKGTSDGQVPRSDLASNKTRSQQSPRPWTVPTSGQVPDGSFEVFQLPNSADPGDRNSVPDFSHSNWSASQLMHIDEVVDLTPQDWFGTLNRTHHIHSALPPYTLTPQPSQNIHHTISNPTTDQASIHRIYTVPLPSSSTMRQYHDTKALGHRIFLPSNIF